MDLVSISQFRLYLATITQPLISILFGIIGVLVVVVAVGKLITEAPYVHNAADNLYLMTSATLIFVKCLKEK